MSGMRLFGFGSGMDIDQIVQQMMKAERVRYDQVKGKKQTLVWKQDMYREMNKSFSAVRDVVEKMRWEGKWRNFSVSSSNDQAVSVTNSGTSTATSHTISVTKLADSAKLSTALPSVKGTSSVNSLTVDNSNNKIEITLGSQKETITLADGTYATPQDIKQALQSSIDAKFGANQIKIDVTSDNKITLTPKALGTNLTVSAVPGNNLLSDLALANQSQGVVITGTVSNPGFTVDATKKSMVVQLGDETKTITLDSKTYDGTAGGTATLRADLQEKIDAAFGAGKITVGLTGDNKITFEPQAYGGMSAPQLKIKSNGADTLLSTLGFSNEQSYKIDLSMTLTELRNRLGMSGSGPIDFKINGVSISVPLQQDGVDNTLKTLMDKVNESSAGVRMSYDTFTQGFSFVSKTTGSNAKIELAEETSGFLAAIGFATPPAPVYGQDAEFTIDGVTSFRNSNTFTLDGLTYNLKQVTTGNVTVNTQWNNEETFKQIKDFVEKYNEMVKTINDKIREKKYRDFQPLTDEQKKEMKEKEIELWEEKAKSGILRNDNYLSSAISDMRNDLYKAVTDLSVYSQLTQIGIETSNKYSEHGKLIINEDKLRDAISKNPEAVVQLFAKKPTSPAIPLDKNNPAPYEERERLRNEESGLAVRLFNRLEKAIDSIKIRIDNKGFETGNDTSIAKEIKNIDKRLLRMDELLKEKEDRYYKQFAAMEKQMSQLNAQGSWLAAQFGGGGR